MNALKAVTAKPKAATLEPVPEEEAEAVAPPPTATFRSLETCYVLQDVHTATWLRAASVLIGKTQAESRLDQVRDVTLMLSSIAVFAQDPTSLKLRSTPWFPAPLVEYGSMRFCNCPVTACFRWIAWLAHRTWTCGLTALEIPDTSLTCVHDISFADLKSVIPYAWGTTRLLLWFFQRFRGHYAYDALLHEQRFLCGAMGALCQLLFATSPDFPSDRSQKERLQAIHQSINMLELLVATHKKPWVVNTTLINHLRGLYWGELGHTYKTKHAFRESLWAYTQANAAVAIKRFREELVSARAQFTGADLKTPPFDCSDYTISYTPVLPAPNQCVRMVLHDEMKPIEDDWLIDIATGALPTTTTKQR